MTQPILAAVVSHLDRHGISCALVGAAALAVHGVARSTFDLDLLTTDVRALDEGTWAALCEAGMLVTVRRGDSQDPLAGAVRVESVGQRTVDVIVGRGRWQEAIVRRAEPIEIEGARIPVVRAADLILLKLYAGGSQDAWDIEQLLGVGGRQQLVAAVEAELRSVPPDAQARWYRIRG